ncbi:hypothetical protein H6763_00575 [Candidatus Nomurabacteria bacterium]|uniref:Uncharacterized protein n=1 Tax=Candidatus Dojkabacteria bacterium TaxID=2099670 RepID=A0A955I4N2_9BACT|nr:hypothetical protein [Candidatus Dojkabacteria bacterium]MCB9790172.1 hypothetical protein [Candidatus Nomurabacteria bacterium]MCB9803308.1 hypothetical protein [Candidatus Nomurabacteria bacterium]
MDEYQRYHVKGVKDPKEADYLIKLLEEAGYYQCEFEMSSSELYIPIAFADMIDDIEELMLDNGIELLED